MQCLAVNPVRVSAGISIRLHRMLQILHMTAQRHQHGHQGNETQSDSGFPPEFTTLITPTSKIKANVTRKGVITLARLGSYGRPYG